MIIYLVDQVHHDRTQCSFRRTPSEAVGGAWEGRQLPPEVPTTTATATV